MADLNRFGKLIFVEELDSTNKYLERLADEGQREELVVHTDFQSQGCGYDTNSWESERGKNSLFSFFIDAPKVEAANQFLLSKIVCLAVYNILNKELPGQDVKIKWPNDMYVGNKKIAGVLIKHRVSQAALEYSIVGIGLNVNQMEFRSAAPNPVSLAQLSGQSYDPEKLITDILKEVEDMLAVLPEEEALHARYHELLFGLGKSLNYRVDGKVQPGVIEGVDEFGRLRLHLESGLFLADFKQVELIHDRS